MSEKDLRSAEIIERPAEQENTGLASIASSMSGAQLQKAVDKQKQQREIITKFVADQLVEGVDYGRIHINKNCENKYNCKSKGHFSKKVLFKPGQEKIFSLFGITAVCEKDSEALEMLGNTPGTVALICKVYKNGRQIAEGRGAATVGDLKRDANSTLKIAEKRARMDACLSLGFSEFFTQDLEDGDYTGDGAAGSSGNGDTTPPASLKQKNFILKLLKEKGIEDEAIQLATIAHMAGIKEAKELTLPQAKELIDKLLKGQVEKPPAEDGETPPTPPAKGLGPGYMAQSKATGPAASDALDGEIVDEGPLGVNEPEPVAVDEAFKKDVEAKMVD